MVSDPDRGHPRVALVAGGSGGIGSAVAGQLAKGGATVWVGYRRGQDRAHDVAGKIVAAGGRARSVHLDVCDTELIRAVCAQVHGESGGLDILVDAAARNIEAPVAGMEDDAWREVLEANLNGAFRLCREAARYMVLGRWGRIVNVSSVVAARGGRGQANYAASKAGLEALTRVLAIELGRKGVVANCVAPGVIETEMSARVRSEYGERLLEQTAVRRFGSAMEVAAVVAWLCSEEAGYITGQVIRVDGGLLL